MATLSDNFNRANGGLGANWTTSGGFTAPAIVSNAWTNGASGVQTEALYTGSGLIGTAQSTSVTLTTRESGNSVINLLLRVTDTTAGRGGYIGQINDSLSLFRIIRLDGGVETVLTTAASTIANADVFTFEARNNTLTLKRNGSSVLTWDDSNYSGIGYQGLGGYSVANTIVLDDWSASDLTGGGLLLRMVN